MENKITESNVVTEDLNAEISFADQYSEVGTFPINEKLLLKKYKHKEDDSTLYALVHFNFEDEILIYDETMDLLFQKFTKIKSL